MSDAEETDAGVSDGELDNEFDDFDPLEGSDEAAGADDEAAGADDSDEDDNGADGEGDDDAPGRAAGRARRRDAPASLPAQSVGTRRIIVVAPEERLSSNMMTLAEATRAIALRAKQISTHPYAYTDVGDLSDASGIARKEFFDRASPLNLEREMGRTAAGESIIERWAVREMAYPPLD